MTSPEAMLQLLRDLEWSGRSGVEGEDASCPECNRCQFEAEHNRDKGEADDWGHAVECRLSRFVHGEISEAQRKRIAEAEAQAAKEQAEWDALTPEERDARQRRSLVELEQMTREWIDRMAREMLSQPFFTDARPAWTMANLNTKGTK